MDKSCYRLTYGSCCDPSLPQGEAGDHTLGVGLRHPVLLNPPLHRTVPGPALSEELETRSDDQTGVKT